ncbi:MAG TPA: hypothetical protein VM555_11560, partial [Tahibacter sp.]|nr:hypothetical protein [Tahibacter sp.]
MPSPLVYTRPSGLFVRFWVPPDLRDRVGSKFIVRALGRIDADTARLLAALMGCALSSVYGLLRRESAMAIDVKELLRKAQAGELRDWTSSAIRLPNGAVLENVQVSTPQDARTFAHALDALGRIAPAAAVPAANTSEPVAGPGLSERIRLFLAQFAQRKLSAKVSIDTQWSLRLFEAVVGDVPLS